MTDFRPNPTATLLTGGSPIANAVVQRVGWRVNEGWSWSAVVRGPLDLYQARYTTYQITWTDGLGNSRSTPDLVWLGRSHQDQYNVSSPNLTSMSGVDLTTTKMKQNNQSFASFLASSTGAIISALATRAGVTVTGYSGNPLIDFYVIEEDVKNAKLSDALERITAVSAFEHGVNEAGEIALRAWEDPEVTLNFDWSERVHNLDPRSLFTGLRLGKRSSLSYVGEQVYDLSSVGFVNQALNPFLSLPTAANESIAGAGNIAAVTFYNASDQWVQHYDFTLGSRPAPGGPQGSGQATYFVAEVTPPTIATQVRARVRVNGTPPGGLPSGIDPEFIYPPMATSLGEWPAESDFVDQLFPSLAYATSRHPQLKNKLNAPADTLSLVGPLQANSTVKLFARHTYQTREYKVHGIDWDFSSNQTRIDLVRQTSEV